ncbi:MAG TPA: aminotransferase class I/II-fold pyridoxal phosphate-dependent enzyme, partial [Actinomycetota bacterium]|nr:aminotransferase class I/II-fold pyridoxal phosphate-dependent enzyme [Actinomycetota bacterium]
MMSQRVYLSPPDVGELEERYLLAAIRSGWVAPLGPDVDAFEASLAAYSARDHCVALTTGTAALHLGLLTLGVKPGDLVLTSTMTFAATANAIVYTGAQPHFIDSDTSGNLDPDLLEVALDDLAQNGVLPTA